MNDFAVSAIPFVQSIFFVSRWEDSDINCAFSITWFFHIIYLAVWGNWRCFLMHKMLLYLFFCVIVISMCWRSTKLWTTRTLNERSGDHADFFWLNFFWSVYYSLGYCDFGSSLYLGRNSSLDDPIRCPSRDLNSRPILCLSPYGKSLVLDTLALGPAGKRTSTAPPYTPPPPHSPCVNRNSVGTHGWSNNGRSFG